MGACSSAHACTESFWLHRNPARRRAGEGGPGVAAPAGQLLVEGQGTLSDVEAESAVASDVPGGRRHDPDEGALFGAAFRAHKVAVDPRHEVSRHQGRALEANNRLRNTEGSGRPVMGRRESGEGRKGGKETRESRQGGWP